MAESISIGIELEGGDEVAKQLEATQDKINDVAKAAEELHDTDGTIKVEAQGAEQAVEQIKAIDEELKTAKGSADELSGSLGQVGSTAGDTKAATTGMLDPVSQTATIASAAMDGVQLAMHRAETAAASLGEAAVKMGARMTRALGPLGVLARAFGPIGIAAGVVAGVLTKFGDSTADALNKLTVESAKLDLTAQQLDRLQQAFGRLGVAPDALTSSLEKLKATGLLGGGLLRLGDLVPPDAFAALQQFIAQLEKMPDGIARTKLALSTLGDALGGQVIAGLQTGTTSAKIFADALASVTPATQKQIVDAARYQQALNQLSNAWNDLKTVITPITTPILEFLARELKTIRAEISNLIAQWNVFVAALKLLDSSSFERQQAAARELKTAWDELQKSNAELRNHYQQTGQAAAQAGQAGAQAGQQAGQGVQVWSEELGKAVPAATQAGQAAAQMGQQGVQAGQQVASGMQPANQALSETATQANTTAQAVQGVKAPDASSWTTWGQTVIGVLQNAISKLLEWLGLKDRAGGTPVAGGKPIGSGGIGSNARGGLIGGRGSGTSDSNLAWLSRGEYITPARAVAQPGVLAFLEALRRSGGNLSAVLDSMGRFALGGMIPRMPAFAAGGSVGSMSHVTIAFPGLPPISGLRASSDVVDQLHRAAALAQVRSGGRKPSRYS